MSEVESLTVAILREIRDGVLDTNRRLDRTREELGAEIRDTNQRLDATNQRLDQVVQEQIRQATLWAAMRLDQERMAEALVSMRDAIGGLNERIDHILVGPMGQSVRDLDRRMTSVEQRLDAFERRSG
jgi:prefoldin subunit 5